MSSRPQSCVDRWHLRQPVERFARLEPAGTIETIGTKAAASMVAKVAAVPIVPDEMRKMRTGMDER